jgi:gamma-F420-2:alpha-L-glutamate ligase
MTAKRVWILQYGQGTENYETQRLLAALTDAGFDASVQEPKFFDVIVSRAKRRSIRRDAETVDLPDLVLSRTGAASGYFTLALMRQFERLGIPVLNDSRSVEMVSDKLSTMQLLSQEGLPIPKTLLMNGDVDADLVEKEIGWPCVVKATSGSKGRTVYLCQSRAVFEGLMELLGSIALKKVLIVQEFVAAAPGTDLRVWVIGGKTVAAMKRTGAEGDFRANISQGGGAETFEITEEVDYLARETARILGLQIAGVDLLFDRDGFKICEANSSPGFKGMDRYCGQDMAQRIVDYIKLKL